VSLDRARAGLGGLVGLGRCPQTALGPLSRYPRISLS